MEIFGRLRATILVLLIAFVFSTSAIAKDIRKVERGMSKAQVTEIAGKPMATSFDDAGERWTYEKTRGGMLTPYTVRITVEFDNEGKVVKYNETKLEEKMSELSEPSRSYGGETRPSFGGRRNAPLSDSDFNILVSKVRGASFDDRKLDLIQVACLGAWLTCRQGASLMSVFSFSDKKQKALQFIAPRLVDLQNTNEIYRLFTFSSDKDKAAETISRSRH